MTLQMSHARQTFQTVRKGKKLFTMNRFLTMMISKHRKQHANVNDKKSNVVIKAKSIPVTTELRSILGGCNERTMAGIYLQGN